MVLKWKAKRDINLTFKHQNSPISLHFWKVATSISFVVIVIANSKGFFPKLKKSAPEVRQNAPVAHYAQQQKRCSRCPKLSFVMITLV